MKKVLGIILIVTLTILLIGCEPEKYYCGCPYCDEQAGVCEKECTYGTTGECTCTSCAKPIPTTIKDNIEVISIPYSINNPEFHININVSRPAVNGLSDYIFQQSINDEIANSIVPYQDEIAKLAEGFSANPDNMMKTKSYKYFVTYDSYRLGNFLSIVVKHNIHTGNMVSSDNTGKTDGLRSSEWRETYVIDVKSNKKVKLSDICSFSDWNKTITNEINKIAEAQGIDIILGNGLQNIPANQKFYIDSEKEKIIIYYEPGSIAKYSAGELLLELPYTYNQDTNRFDI